MIDVVGVKFKNSSKIYYFDPMDFELDYKDKVIVETVRGIEYASIAVEKKSVPQDQLVSPLKPIIRLATDEDIEQHGINEKDASEAMDICSQKVEEHGLDMRLMRCEYTFDRAKLIFYFTSDNRVDFRELVRDLASIFRTRIELRQIGVRDEARHLGGYGICGREYCCKTWLSEFEPVSIKMAKDQDLSLNPTKISGACSRLMCCLNYEQPQYEGLIKMMPSVGERVMTPDGAGKVIATQLLLQKVKVILDDDDSMNFKIYNFEELGEERNKDREKPVSPIQPQNDGANEEKIDEDTKSNKKTSARKVGHKPRHENPPEVKKHPRKKKKVHKYKKTSMRIFYKKTYKSKGSKKSSHKNDHGK